MDRLNTTPAGNRGSSSNNFGNNYTTGNHDAVTAFKAAMIEHGITPPDHIINGVGQRKARAAATAVRGKYIIPPTTCHDWNDELTTRRPA